MKKIILKLLFLIILFFGPVAPVKAQQIGLSISPPILEVVIEPGKQITKAYQITNKSERDLYLVPKVVTFVPKDLDGNVQLRQQQENEIFSLANSNLDLGSAFKLTANNSQQLVLKISIPADYPQKDLYQTFLIEQSDEGGFVKQSGGKSLIKIGSNILVSVADEAAPQKQAEIDQFIPQPKFADLFDQVEFKVIAGNSGRHFFKTYGRIEINHSWFKKSKNIDLLPENVLAQSSRQVKCISETMSQNDRRSSTDVKQEQGEFEKLKIVNCKFSSWLPGPYQAELTLAPSENDSVSQTIIFWLIPYRAVFALIIISILIWQIMKKLKSNP